MITFEYRFDVLPGKLDEYEKYVAGPGKDIWLKFPGVEVRPRVQEHAGRLLPATSGPGRPGKPRGAREDPLGSGLPKGQDTSSTASSPTSPTPCWSRSATRRNSSSPRPMRRPGNGSKETRRGSRPRRRPLPMRRAVRPMERRDARLPSAGRAPARTPRIGGPLMIGSRQGDAHALQVRGDLLRSYGDVFTPEAMAALAALAPLDAPRRALMAARIQRRARAPATASASRSSTPRRRFRGTDITVQDARDGKFERQRDPGRPASGSGSRARARRRGRTRPWSRASATSPTRCSPAPTAGCSTARTRSARSRRCRSTTSATSSWPSRATRSS